MHHQQDSPPCLPGEQPPVGRMCVSVRVYVCVPMCVCVCVSVRVHVRANACAFAYACAFSSVSVCVSASVIVCVRTTRVSGKLVLAGSRFLTPASRPVIPAIIHFSKTNHGF
jgi:hypothetical protein